MADQFDISPERRKVLEENAKRRQVLREQFLRQATDPFKHASEAGTVFDPAMQRHHAMRVLAYDHFRPNLNNTSMFLFGVVIPVVGLSLFLHYDRKKKEEQMRGGLVPYKDRMFKFI